MSERNYAIDFIRFVAIIGVVLIHTSTSFTDKLPKDSIDFYIIHFLNQFSRFSVPLFFAISGFLLGARYSDIKSPLNFYKKRLSKILIPYISWSLIYYLFIFPHPFSGLLTWRFYEGLFRGTLSYQLYFIPAILILYALFPLIIYGKKIFLNKFSILLLFLVMAVILSNTYYFRQDLRFYLPIKNAIYNLLPFMVGVYLGVRNVNILKIVTKKIAVFVSVFLGLLGLVFFESIYMFKTFNNSLFLRDQWRISVMIYGLFSGGFFYYIHEKFLKKYYVVIRYLSGFSFGIFFVHVAILHNLMRHVINPNQWFGIIPFVLSFVFVSAISLVFSIAFAKIKLVDRILGLRG